MAGPSQEFVHAVLLSFDLTASPALRSSANASLDALRQSEGGWLFCLQAFTQAGEEHVKFWCLQTLVDMVVRQRRYASLPPQQQLTLRQALSSWLQSKGEMATDEPASVKNKFAQLLVSTRIARPTTALALRVASRAPSEPSEPACRRCSQLVVVLLPVSCCCCCLLAAACILPPAACRLASVCPC